MKKSLSFAVALAAAGFCFGQAQAVVPDSSASLNSCLEWAHTQGANTKAAVDRCQALNDCNVNESTGALELRDCIFSAETAYLTAIGEPPTTAQGELGDRAGVVTEVADSDYEIKGGDAKGFRDSTVGK